MTKQEANKKRQTIKMILENIKEVEGLMNEGHMPVKEAKPLIRKWKKLCGDISANRFDLSLIITKHPELFMNHTMLYHPDHQDTMLKLAKMLGVS